MLIVFLKCDTQICQKSVIMNVPAEIVWLPKMSFQFIAKQFTELFGVELLTENESLDSEEFEESYRTVFTTLKIKKSNFMLLVNRWCSQAVDRYQMYLSLEKAMVLEDANRALDDKWIKVETMSFGTMVGLNKFAEHYSVVEQNTNTKFKFKVANINVDFQHDMKLMSVYFHVTDKKVKPKDASAATHRPHRFEYDYSAIEKVLINTTESKSIDVYFYFSHPPLIYIVVLPIDAENKLYENYIYQSPETTYSRVYTFADCCHSDIGLSTVLKLQFSSKNSWDAICNFLLNAEKTRYYFSPILPLPKKKSYPIPEITGGQFNCIYALQTILSRSREVVVQIDERKNITTVNMDLKKFAEGNPKALEAALLQIYFLFERRKLVNFSTALGILYDKFDKMINSGKNDTSNISTSLSVPENMIEVRRAVLTPTRIIFLPPQPYFRCRFFRECEAEYTIRLSVKDDNIGNLSFTLFGRPKSSLEMSEQHDDPAVPAENHDSESESEEDSYGNVTLERIKKQLLKGFEIGQRRYEWLGCSTSHFREHGVLYYAKDSKCRNAAKARQMMGDFGDINSPSKYLARLGLVFSQSLAYIIVRKHETAVEDDIEIPRPQKKNEFYTFSDGIGKMSPLIAKKVSEKMNITYNPSAIQIRYAGCKGMLMQWPGLNNQIIFRKSMKKFESHSEYLEILKVSKPRLVYLNRPFITILSQLGVPDEVFLELQNNNLNQYFKSLIYEDTSTATLHVHSALRVDYQRIHNAGINVVHEPFFCSMTRNIFQQCIAKLTRKARIQIPEDKGRTMFGVLDETKTLEYGQVFVQYTKDIHHEKDNAETVRLNDQIVLVTKYPCMHPGDVRKFIAVDVEALHHIKDCIVFPAKGRRPHPDEMAGSDLDGDEYSVIWEKELVFRCDNYDPMDFPTDDAIKLKNAVHVRDMVEFFCQYIHAGQVGQIATAHLVWADHDSEEGGIFSKKCKELARKYSINLDSAKRGKVERMHRNERATIYPDFLEKGLLSDTYISKNILGQLYRCCKTVLLGFEGLICKSAYEPDEALNYPGHENYKESAKEAMHVFNQEVEAILQQYGIESEGELFSGAILGTSKYTFVKQDLNDLTVIEYRIKKLFKETQRKFCSEFHNQETEIPPLITLVYDKSRREQAFQKASAWYMVTCEQPESGKRYFAFPWTVHEILCELRKESKKCPNKHIARMDEILMENYQREINDDAASKNAEAKAVAFKLICRWMDKQPFITSEEDKREYDFLIGKIYDEVANELEIGREEQSVYKTVLRCLHRISLLIFRGDLQCRRSQQLCFRQQEIVGLLAFKTLLNLLYCHEFNPSCLIAEDMKSYKQVFRIPLSEDSVFRCIVDQRDKFLELLKDWTKVEEVELRLKHGRLDKWFVLFTVKGNRYALHDFQDVIFQSSFQRAVKNLL